MLLLVLREINTTTGSEGERNPPFLKGLLHKYRQQAITGFDQTPPSGDRGGGGLPTPPSPLLVGDSPDFFGSGSMTNNWNNNQMKKIFLGPFLFEFTGKPTPCLGFGRNPFQDPMWCDPVERLEIIRTFTHCSCPLPRATVPDR